MHGGTWGPSQTRSGNRNGRARPRGGQGLAQARGLVTANAQPDAPAVGSAQAREQDATRSPCTGTRGFRPGAERKQKRPRQAPVGQGLARARPHKSCTGRINLALGAGREKKQKRGLTERKCLI